MIELVQGDNETVMADLAGQGRKFALAYADPPFLTNRIFKMGDEVAFDDRWKNHDAYLEKLERVSRACWVLLEPHGSFVLHVDPKVSHYAKVMLDRIFGIDNFASEIIWRYRRWPAKTLNYQRVHDVLLRYRRDINTLPRFNQLYEPLAASTLATWGSTRQSAVHDDDGRRVRSSRTGEPSQGVPLGDVWDIGIIAPTARERTGFPTQKPEKLLERLVLSLTVPGDRVLDPYCGSGSTLAVCARHGRSAVGIDSSPVAIRVARKRLFGEEARPCAP